jgi:predicted  nucleic acid-binding Zn-ribbon protein
MGATDFLVGDAMGEMRARRQTTNEALRVIDTWRVANAKLERENDQLRYQLETVTEERNRAEGKRNGLLCLREGYREGTRFLERRFRELGVPEEEVKKFMDQYGAEIDKKRDEVLAALNENRIQPEDLF